MPGENLSLSWLSSAVSIQDKDSDGHERGDGGAFAPLESLPTSGSSYAAVVVQASLGPGSAGMVLCL